MDFSGYTEFPFPSALPIEDRHLERYFNSLPDAQQLQLLHNCKSYAQFRDRVAEECREAGSL